MALGTQNGNQAHGTLTWEIPHSALIAHDVLRTRHPKEFDGRIPSSIIIFVETEI